MIREWLVNQGYIPPHRLDGGEIEELLRYDGDLDMTTSDFDTLLNQLAEQACTRAITDYAYAAELRDERRENEAMHLDTESEEEEVPLNQRTDQRYFLHHHHR